MSPEDQIHKINQLITDKMWLQQSLIAAQVQVMKEMELARQIEKKLSEEIKDRMELEQALAKALARKMDNRKRKKRK